MSRQSQAIIGHFNRLARNAGEAVSIRRDGNLLVDRVVLVPGNNQPVPSTAGVATVFAGSQDWLVLSSTIQAVLPLAKGDVIEHLGTGRKWRISRSGSDDYCRPCDAMGIMLRIFTKELTAA